MSEEEYEELRDRDRLNKYKLRGAKIVNEFLTKSIGGICGLCGEPVEFNKSEVDHIIPISLGGNHIEENVHIVHISCNRRKKDHMDYIMGIP